MNNDNMNIEVNLLEENFVILDERTGGYSKKTKIQDIFNVYKQITLDKCRSKDEKTAWVDDFKNYSCLVHNKSREYCNQNLRRLHK